MVCAAVADTSRPRDPLGSPYRTLSMASGLTGTWLTEWAELRIALFVDFCWAAGAECRHR